MTPLRRFLFWIRSLRFSRDVSVQIYAQTCYERGVLEGERRGYEVGLEDAYRALTRKEPPDASQ